MHHRPPHFRNRTKNAKLKRNSHRWSLAVTSRCAFPLFLLERIKKERWSGIFLTKHQKQQPPFPSRTSLTALSSSSSCDVFRVTAAKIVSPPARAISLHPLSLSPAPDKLAFAKKVKIDPHFCRTKIRTQFLLTTTPRSHFSLSKILHRHTALPITRIRGPRHKKRERKNGRKNRNA